jgi:hypothetical protein
MGQVLNVLLHVLLLGSLGVYVLVLIRVVLRSEDTVERFIRATALFCGAMIVVGSQAAGGGYASFIVESLSSARPGAAFFAAVIPGLFGVGIGWYIVYAVKHRGEDIAIRILALVGMLAAASFASIYAVAMKEEAGDIGRAAIPNIAFVTGITLYVILNYGKRSALSNRRPGLRDALVERVRGERERTTAPEASTFVATDSPAFGLEDLGATPRMGDTPGKG